MSNGSAAALCRARCRGAGSRGAGSFLLQAQEFLNLLYVGFVNESEVGEVTFLFFGFLGQDVTFESVFSFDFS